MYGLAIMACTRSNCTLGALGKNPPLPAARVQFQRPPAEIELSAEDASSRGIASGDAVRVSSNGTSVELRARVSKKLRAGVARAAEEHTTDLQSGVEVSRA